MGRRKRIWIQRDTETHRARQLEADTRGARDRAIEIWERHTETDRDRATSRFEKLRGAEMHRGQDSTPSYSDGDRETHADGDSQKDATHRLQCHCYDAKWVCVCCFLRCDAAAVALQLQ